VCWFQKDEGEAAAHVDQLALPGPALHRRLHDQRGGGGVGVGLRRAAGLDARCAAQLLRGGVARRAAQPGGHGGARAQDQVGLWPRPRDRLQLVVCRQLRCW